MASRCARTDCCKPSAEVNRVAKRAGSTGPRLMNSSITDSWRQTRGPSQARSCKRASADSPQNSANSTSLRTAPISPQSRTETGCCPSTPIPEDWMPHPPGVRQYRKYAVTLLFIQSGFFQSRFEVVGPDEHRRLVIRVVNPLGHGAPHRAQRCPGAQALNIGAAKTIGVGSQVADIDPRRQRLVPQMYLKDQAAALLIGQGDIDDLVKTPRPQNGRIEHVHPVGRAQQEHALQ